MSRDEDGANPHHGQPVATTGPPLAEASAAAILVHGRGASARGMLGLVDELGRDDVAFLAPQAEGHTWYPESFLAPVEANEPKLTSALWTIEDLLARVTDAGVPLDRTVLLGFSQGACLTLEFVARQPDRYGAVVGFSGGLVGPDLADRAYEGSLNGTPVFLGCSDVDPHIPLERVRETERVLSGLGADVTTHIYERMGHTVNDDELAHAADLLAAVREE